MPISDEITVASFTIYFPSLSCLAKSLYTNKGRERVDNDDDDDRDVVREGRV